MLSLLVGLIVLGAFLFYVTTAEERARRVWRLQAVARHAIEAVVRYRAGSQPFRDALRARTPWVLVTPALAALNVTLCAFMVAGTSAIGDPETLVAWGGSLGPRTTNGEWWRLATAMFVHAGFIHLLANTVVTIQLGFILERLFGPVSFGAVYLGAGILAGLVSVAEHPVTVNVGASGAIFGLYGLLITSAVWGVVHRSSLTIPLKTGRVLSGSAALFAACSAATAGLDAAAVVIALIFGSFCGFVLLVGTGDLKPPPRRIVTSAAAAVVAALAFAAPVHGIADVRSEITGIVALEARTSSAYQTAAGLFKEGRITAAALSQVIGQTIVPELQAAQAHLYTLEKVPLEQMPFVTSADEYLRLRQESWRLRAEGMSKGQRSVVRSTGRAQPESDATWRLRAEAEHRATLRTLGKAEGAERVALEALERIRVHAADKLSSL